MELQSSIPVLASGTWSRQTFLGDDLLLVAVAAVGLVQRGVGFQGSLSLSLWSFLVVGRIVLWGGRSKHPSSDSKDPTREMRLPKGEDRSGAGEENVKEDRRVKL